MSKRGRVRNRANREALSAARIASAAVGIGTWLGTEAQCAEGTAMLVAVARALGVQARCQPVHTYGLYSSVEQESTLVFVTSQTATRALQESGEMPVDIASDIETASDFGWSGHLVAIVEKPRTLWDTTFGQFSVHGFPDTVVRATRRREDGSWEMWSEKPSPLLVRYIPADEPEIVRGCEMLVRSWSDWAADAASVLLSGGSVGDIPWPGSWPQFKALDPLRDHSGGRMIGPQFSFSPDGNWTRSSS